MTKVYILRVAENSTHMVLFDRAELEDAVKQEIDDSEGAGVLPEAEGGMLLLIHTEDWSTEKIAEAKARFNADDYSFPGW